MRNTIIQGDCLTVLRAMSSGIVQSCVTSPPYFGLRDYGNAEQIGLEETPEAYVQKLVEVFSEVKRVLRDDGVLWLNLGDSYAGSGKGYGSKDHGKLGQHANEFLPPPIEQSGLAPKNLIGIPWRVAFALQSDGWILRSAVIWHKPNAMPESVRDRPTTDYEHVFLLAKNERYFYDSEAIKEPHSVKPHAHGNSKQALQYHSIRNAASDAAYREPNRIWGSNGVRNKRSVWTIPTKPYSGAHFAVMPEKLVEPCILASTSSQACEHCGAAWQRVTECEQVRKAKQSGKRWLETPSQRPDGYKPTGLSAEYQSVKHTTGWQPTCKCENTGSGKSIVLDCFAGAGTVPLVAMKSGRQYIGIELNQTYINLANERIAKEAGLWEKVA